MYLGKGIFIISIVFLTIIEIQAQDSREKIKSYLDKEIYFSDSWSGQNITLVKEKKKYFIIRKFFGSGLPIAGTYKYVVKFNSDYQLEFSEIIYPEGQISKANRYEVFIVTVEDSGVAVYLNGLKLITEMGKHPNN